MVDVYDKTTRSNVMSKMASKGNKSTEMKLITIFRDYDIKGWRRQYQVKGHPDFVFLEQRIAIFIDGCFWHGHDCRNTRPKIMKIIGVGRLNVIWSVMKRLQNIFRSEDGM